MKIELSLQRRSKSTSLALPNCCVAKLFVLSVATRTGKELLAFSQKPKSTSSSESEMGVVCSLGAVNIQTPYYKSVVQTFTNTLL